MLGRLSVDITLDAYAQILRQGDVGKPITALDMLFNEELGMVFQVLQEQADQVQTYLQERSGCPVCRLGDVLTKNG